jgi:hypothetical protein
MTDDQVKQMLKDNWIGKMVSINGRKYEVIDENKNQIQVIESGKWSPQWRDKSEVGK